MLQKDFSQLAIFEGLTAAQLTLLEPLISLFHFNPNHVIFDQGQDAHYLYILQQGEVQIRFKPYDGPPLIVTRIQAGGVFGWSAALGREEYTSAAVAVQECTTYRINGTQLHELCQQHPDAGVILLERLAGVIAERLRSTHASIFDVLSRSMHLDPDYTRRIERYG